MAGSGALADVQRLVTAHYGARATEPRLLGAGDWSQAFSFALDGQDAVIRFGRHVEDFRKDRVMAGYSSAALPVPAVTEIGRTADGYFAVSERATGQLLDDLDSAGMRAALPSLLRALDALRALAPPGGRGYGGWAPGGTAAAASWPQALLAVGQESARVPGWQTTMSVSPVGTSPFRMAYARLEELITGLPPRRHFVHQDLLNRNVLVQGAKITAIIDWGNALYGDYLYDAAWLIFWWSWFPAWQAIDIRQELHRHWAQHGGIPVDVEHRLLTYLLHIGLDAMSYSAFRRRWDDLARTADQVRCPRFRRLPASRCPDQRRGIHRPSHRLSHPGADERGRRSRREGEEDLPGPWQ